VPPAWRGVWICPDPHGHIQAIGRDGCGRRQYRYHPRWRQLRDEAKFSRTEHSFGIRDRRLSRIVKRCQELPGQEMFRYIDGAGHRRNVGSADVNAYLRALSGRDFTAKDFRTWAGTWAPPTR
jgi:DNA topoisomerase IB